MASRRIRNGSEHTRTVREWLLRLPWSSVLLLLLLGLAPFVPEPHLVEKLRMLASGRLERPIDLFDLALHGAPWSLLLAKLVATWSTRSVDG